MTCMTHSCASPNRCFPDDRGAPRSVSPHGDEIRHRASLFAFWSRRKIRTVPPSIATNSMCAAAFPSDGPPHAFFEDHAPPLAASAVEKLRLGSGADRITHLLITCCTGLSSPGLDLELIARCGLSPSVERSIIGFMGCYAAINAFKLARHIVRSEPDGARSRRQSRNVHFASSGDGRS